MHCAETVRLPRRLEFGTNSGRAFGNSELDMVVNLDLDRGDEFRK